MYVEAEGTVRKESWAAWPRCSGRDRNRRWDRKDESHWGSNQDKDLGTDEVTLLVLPQHVGTRAHSPPSLSFSPLPPSVEKKLHLRR